MSDEPQRLRNWAAQGYDVVPITEVIRAADAIESLQSRLAAAEARCERLEGIIGYCASPTLGWDASKGPIEAYVWTADEHLVRAALAAIIGQAQRARLTAAAARTEEER